MGDEFGQPGEWDHESSLDWSLLERPEHAGILRWLSDLNGFYRDEPALHELDCDEGGFEWIAADDSLQNVIAFLRRSSDGGRAVLASFNFAPVPRAGYRVGVPLGGAWLERLNGDAPLYGGSGAGNLGRVEAERVPFHGAPWSLVLTLPPLAAVFLVPEGQG
jgi:1,4-alpha-glucan branching enzyme